MPDYREIDWTQDAPSLEAYDASWKRSTLTLVEHDRRLSELTYILSEGGLDTDADQFLLGADPAVAWYLARRRLNETSFLEDLFAHPVLREHDLPVGGPDRDAPIDFGFQYEGSFLAMGRLAQAVRDRLGVNSPYGGSDAKIISLVQDWAEAAFGGRYNEVTTYVSHARWSPWFSEAGLDLSMLWIDPATGLITILTASGRY